MSAGGPFAGVGRGSRPSSRATRVLIAGLAVALLSVSARASAQALGSEPMVSNVNAEASVFLAVPGDDIADLVDDSLGIRGAVGYHLNSHLSAHIAARYIIIRTRDDLLDRGDVTYFDFGVGGRYTHAVTSSLAVAGDLDVVVSQIRVRLPLGGSASRDPGVAGRLSAFFALGPKLHLSAAVGVTRTFASGDDAGTDSRWSDAGVGALFFF